MKLEEALKKKIKLHENKSEITLAKALKNKARHFTRSTKNRGVYYLSEEDYYQEGLLGVYSGLGVMEDVKGLYYAGWRNMTDAYNKATKANRVCLMSPLHVSKYIKYLTGPKGKGKIETIVQEKWEHEQNIIDDNIDNSFTD